MIGQNWRGAQGVATPKRTLADREVRFVELQWLGVHIAFQIGRTP